MFTILFVVVMQATQLHVDASTPYIEIHYGWHDQQPWVIKYMIPLEMQDLFIVPEAIEAQRDLTATAAAAAAASATEANGDNGNG